MSAWTETRYYNLPTPNDYHRQATLSAGTANLVDMACFRDGTDFETSLAEDVERMKGFRDEETSLFTSKIKRSVGRGDGDKALRGGDIAFIYVS